jgi:general stress protein 26
MKFNKTPEHRYGHHYFYGIAKQKTKPMDDHVSNVEHLQDVDAIKKMQELVKHNSMCLFTTQTDYAPLPTRPMATQEVDDNGNFWFMSAIDSNKNQEIHADHRVQLFFSNPGDSEYMTVYGTAQISQDRQRIEELWNPFVKAWFTEGKDDPRISVIKVIPEEAYYWDTKHTKMISMMKIMVSAAIGKTMDDSLEGKLKP